MHWFECSLSVGEGKREKIEEPANMPTWKDLQFHYNLFQSHRIFFKGALGRIFFSVESKSAVKWPAILLEPFSCSSSFSGEAFPSPPFVLTTEIEKER